MLDYVVVPDPFVFPPNNVLLVKEIDHPNERSVVKPVLKSKDKPKILSYALVLDRRANIYIFNNPKQFIRYQG